MTHTLVTGGSGFIGQHLVTALLEQGRRVRILDVRPPACARAGVQFVQGSILDPALVRRALDGVENVYHLAALPGMWMPNKSDFHDVNCRGTEVVIAAAREQGVSRFLHCSTGSILFGASHTEPVLSEAIHTTPDEMPGPYTHSKLMAEQVALLAATSGFPVVVANPTMPIGHHEGSFTPPTMMVRYFLNSRVQIYFDFVLNLVDVRDVAAGLLLAMERGQVGGRYILGGEDISLGKLLEILSSLSGRKPPRVQIPAGSPDGGGDNGVSLRPHHPRLAGGDGRGRADRVSLQAAVDGEIAAGTRLRAALDRSGVAGRGCSREPLERAAPYNSRASVISAL